MKRPASAAAALAAALALLTSAPSVATARDAAPAAAPAVSSVAWKDCGTTSYPTLQCGTLKVPLDHARPHGRTITLALSRVPHTAKHYQGPLLVNPGGPGGSGLTLAGFVASSLPPAVASQYDVIGFDPRGVGRSEPALDCSPGYFDPVRPDPVPHGAKEEAANVARAASFAKACGTKYGSLLKYVDTVSAVRDMDAIRAALHAKKINYFGYSYGTYLGAVYAKLFPERVRRLVLDSIVDPTGVWYEDNINQDYAFDARHKAFMAWTAKHDATYHLGKDPAKIEALWYRVHEKLRTKPAGGKVGPGEFEDSFVPGGYYNGYWPYLAEGFAAYAKNGDEDALVALYEDFAAVGAGGDNGYSIYTSVQCRDASWPRDWRTWHKDTAKVYAKAPFLAWNNAWYNAPCAFWPVASEHPVNVRNSELPPVLLFQATNDAATPYEGGVTVHHLLKRSSLVVEKGGGNHGITLSGNDCLDGYLSAYLDKGTVPRGHGTADAVCDRLPDPEPLTATAKAKASGSAAPDRGLHGLLGTQR
ncbi:alpha/beta hydrolase [Streptomyces sp. NPDC001070]